MPTAALATAAAMVLARLGDQEVRDLMFSVGQFLAVGAGIAAFAFFAWVYNRRPKQRR